MEEINKKKVIKSHSYNENFSKSQSDFIFLKPETDENKLNRSILRRTKKDSDKKVLFNLNKYKIKNIHSKPNQLSSNANESLLKTNVTKKQTNLIETLKKNSENKNMNSINDITNNYVISTDNKTLYKNKSQENIYNTLRAKYNQNNILPNINDNQEENNFNIDLINDITNTIEPKDSGNFIPNIDSDNIPFNDIQFKQNNLESIENLENSINTNQQYQNTNNISKADGHTLPILNRTKRQKDKMWAFLKKSRKEKTSANEIIIHYLKENERDTSKNIPFNNFKKYLKKIDYRKFNYGLDKIYGNSETFLRRLEEIKKNNIIAFKNDFNIESYQSTLLKILKKRVSEKSYIKLQTSYKLFNERNFGVLIPKGRYINLAEKLKDFLSKDIYEKMKKTDRNYLLYLRKQKEEKNKKEMENQSKFSFYQKLNKTLRVFDQKKRRNKSY